MQTFWQDMRYGVRLLFRKPGFTLIVIITLSLGIGAATAIFSVVDAVLWRSLPYGEAERIVHLREVNEKGGRIPVAEPNYVDVRERNRSLEYIAQFAGGTVVVTGAIEAVRTPAYWVSGEFFKVLGVQPIAGRAFLPDESKQGGNKVAVISYGFWQRLLGGRADFSSVKLNIDGPSFTVVGVMPPGFNYPQGAEIWVPREVEEPQTSRTAHNWSVIGKIKPEVSLEQARADISNIGKQLRQQYGSETDAADLALIPLQEYLTTRVQSGLLILLAAVGLLLLVACANVANLLLSQVTARQCEFAVRVALGASRWRMARQMITENLLLTLIAGAAGLVFSLWGVDLLLQLNQGNLPREDEISVNFRALLFTFGLASFIAVALGILPVIRFSSDAFQADLKESGRGQTTNSALRNALVVSQVAITIVLLVGAGLLGRSFLKLLETDPGFRPQSAVAMTISLPTTIGKDEEQSHKQFHMNLLERLGQIPGVVAYGSINALPMTGRGANGTFLKDNNRATPGQADYRLAGAGYFAAMGIPLLRGRLFDQTDTDNAPPAAVISQSLARRYWPNEDPIGRTIQFGNMDGDLRPLVIVGIVGDVRDRGLDVPVSETVYAHSLQRPQWWQVSNLSIVVRAQGNPTSLIPAMRSAVLSLNRDVPIRFQTIEQVFSSSLNTRRFSLVIFGFFAVVALLLAAVGIYGVMAYSVSQRTKDIGVRIALGAQTRDVLTMIMSQGLKLMMIGLVVGIAGAFIVTRWLSSMLYEINPSDPLTYAVITALLIITTLLACWIPARRATKVDPMVALRYE
ncbi:MAG: ABC transporter permease [Blastocatellales bacterium]